MYHGGEAKKKRNPKEKANLLSLITFFFTWDILKKGFKRDIVEDDIYEVLGKFKASKLGDDLEKSWQSQGKTNRSAYKLLWTCYGKYYLLLGIIQLFSKIIMVMLHPRALGKLVSYFTTDSQMTKTDAIYYAAIVVGLNVINCTYSHNYQLWITELGIRIKTAFCSLIYRKSLKLTSSTLSEIGIGRIVTLISKDVMNFEIAIIFLNDMWISLVLLVITSGLMYSRIGISALAGVLFMVLIIPLQVLFGKLTSSLRIRGSKVTDYRLQVTQETLSAIKIIKMYTWENFFGVKISNARTEEMKKIRQIYWTKATSLVVGGLVINLTLYIIVMTYTSLGHNFTAEVAFFLWGCLHSLRSTVTISIPIGIAQTAELVASVRRIMKVLTAKEQPQTIRKESTTIKPTVKMSKVGVTINKSEILHDVTLEINSGLNFVTGRLGGGKSSLLKTILEDYPVSTGELTIRGTKSYASEEPWLFPSSIRQNILFGQEINEERYKKVIKVCALEQDINTFEKLDETIVDDRGMNLSKGQQARISLARAVYCDSDIYLLDDCLSSLDTRVQDYVFRECIRSFLKDKIVIMISHNERQLKEADNVIHMENGTVKSVLKPSEIPEDEIEELVRDDDKIEENDIIDNIVLADEEAEEDTKLLEKKYENIYHEKKKEGKVDFNIYTRYVKFGGGLVILIPVFLLFIAAQFSSSFSEKLVSNWVNIQQNISQYKFNATNTSNYQNLLEKNTKVLNTYSFTVVIATIMLLSRAYAHFFFAGKASVSIHKSMALSVVNASMKFFDLNYLGNILNRFSKDLGTIDETLPLNIYECLRLVCTLGGIITLVIIVNVSFLIPAAVLFVGLFFIRRCYIPTGRSLKRLDSATRSPVIGHVNASLEGLATIRAYSTEKILCNEFDKHQDLYTSAFYMIQCASRAFAYTLDMLCNFFTAAVVIRFLVVKKDTQAGNVGLAITQALQMTGLLQWGIRQWAELENYMTSVERVIEYTTVERENKAGQEITNWPSSGKITYKDVKLTYGKSKEYVLKNINFTIKPREKVGIVGRTGAGKSSLISVLFRLYQFEGTISIDDVDIKTLGLEFLRSNIAIIPQDPIIFTGTIRNNIDPMGLYKDEIIWKAIQTVKLNELIGSLDFKITESGSNFSAGQKQLLCLARAIISQCKIIILDEATANVDPETDVMIYTTIQESFADCTVLTIAHRLHTVMYSDRIMVVDKGEIVEFATPNALLEDKESIFYKMIEQTNLSQ